MCHADDLLYLWNPVFGLDWAEEKPLTGQVTALMTNKACFCINQLQQDY